jgi:two-component system NtrC family sensor kinase
MVDMPWWNRLGVKLAVAITACSALTLGIFLVLVLRSQERHLLDQAQRSAAVVSDTITASIQKDMLHDRKDEAYQITGVIGQQEHVDHLRVFDAAGRVRFSTEPAEVGTVPDIRAESCHPCHGSGTPDRNLTMRERTRVTQRDGVKILGAVTPIYNETSCSTASCHVHPASQRVIGIVELGLRLDAIDVESSLLQRNTILLSLLATLALGTVTFAFTHKMIVRPVAQLVDGTNRVSLGELDRAVPVHGSDELAVLGTSFNQMGQALTQANTERNQLLENLERQVAERTKALERAQAQMIQTEKLSSLGKLAASIAHEINNPLAGILTTAKLLIRTIEERPDDKRATFLVRHLRLVQRETERCTAIVRNLLGFARERPRARSDVDVNAALDEALFLVSSQVGIQNIALERQLEPVPPVRADFGQIRQAFANLLINACDAMPKGGTLRASTRLTGDEMVEVVIADSGTGIPRDVMSKVLDPFFTTKEKGTGLGLSVVYGVVERHGGRLMLDSEPGHGTTVTIRLPLPERVPEDSTPAPVGSHGAP